MIKHLIMAFVFIICITSSAFNQPSEAVTEEMPAKSEIFIKLHEAFQAQLMLGEKYRTKEEAINLLSPHFEDTFIQKFLNENLVKEAQGYIIYGSDFAMYYIPYFSYDENTKIVYGEQGDRIYVYEYFPAVEDGPVTYGNHYEMISLTKGGSDWKVNDYVYSETKPEID